MKKPKLILKSNRLLRLPNCAANRAGGDFQNRRFRWRRKFFNSGVAARVGDTLYDRRVGDVGTFCCCSGIVPDITRVIETGVNSPNMRLAEVNAVLLTAHCIGVNAAVLGKVAFESVAISDKLCALPNADLFTFRRGILTDANYAEDESGGVEIAVNCTGIATGTFR